jgi:hypothetical protein
VVSEGLRDFPAEVTVVGCAIDNPTGARLAIDRCTPDDFGQPVLGDLLLAAAQIADVPPTIDDEGLPGARIDAVCAIADVRRQDVVELVKRRLVMSDSSGHFAARVVTAAQRRRLLAALDDARRQLLAGQPIEDVVLLVASATEEAADPTSTGERLRHTCDTVRTFDGLGDRGQA